MLENYYVWWNHNSSPLCTEELMPLNCGAGEDSWEFFE